MVVIEHHHHHHHLDFGRRCFDFKIQILRTGDVRASSLPNVLIQPQSLFWSDRRFHTKDPTHQFSKKISKSLNNNQTDKHTQQHELHRTITNKKQTQ